MNLPAVSAAALPTATAWATCTTTCPGVLASINQLIAEAGANVVGQYLATTGELGYVVTDSTEAIPAEVVAALAANEHCRWVRTWDV